MKNIELSVKQPQGITESKASVPAYDRKDFKDSMLEALGNEVFDVCDDIDHKMAMLRSYATTRMSIDNKVVDAALEAYGQNNGYGRLGDYLFREVEKKNKKK